MKASSSNIRCSFFALMKVLLLITSIFFVFSLHAQIRIKAVGDVMMGSYTPSTIIPPNNGQVFVDSIARYLDSADITFGNLEGVFINGDVKPQKCSEKSRKAHRCYEFGMPDTLGYTLKKLNFDIMSMDNNHNSDYGWQGVRHTKKKLDEVGIHYASKKSPSIIKFPYQRDSTVIQKDTFFIFSPLKVSEYQTTFKITDTIEIAIVAFGHSSISYHVGNLDSTRKIIEQLSKKHNIVLVSFHGGAEGTSAQHVKDETESYYGENRGNVYRFAHTAIDAGADMVIGHGPHVLRAFEIYKNKFICYSLGNFLTYGNVNIREVKGLGAIIDINIDPITGEFISGKVIPTRQVDRGIPAYDHTGEALKVISTLTKSDFPDGNVDIRENGTIIQSNK